MRKKKHKSNHAARRSNFVCRMNESEKKKQWPGDFAKRVVVFLGLCVCQLHADENINSATRIGVNYCALVDNFSVSRTAEVRETSFR